MRFVASTLMTVLIPLSALLSMPGAQAANNEAPKFSGVWQPINPPAALLTSNGKAPPLLPAARTVYEQRKAMLAKGDTSFDPTITRCAPPGSPRIYTENMPFDILQTSKKVLIGFQWNRLQRHIELDKPMDIINPTYLGTSVGKISGKSLEVDSDGFNDRFFLDRSGMPHSEALKLHETFTLNAKGDQLQIRIRIEDSQTFSAPWETVLNFRKLTGVRIAEDICTMRQNLVPEDLKFFDPK
ncbi:MAG: hypothetical protein QM808_17125 [Steroidobacteraceae bacterium]